MRTSPYSQSLMSLHGLQEVTFLTSQLPLLMRYWPQNPLLFLSRFPCFQPVNLAELFTLAGAIQLKCTPASS